MKIRGNLEENLEEIQYIFRCFQNRKLDEIQMKFRQNLDKIQITIKKFRQNQVFLEQKIS